VCIQLHKWRSYFQRLWGGRCIVMCASTRNILCMSLQSLGFLADQISSKLFECHEKFYFNAGLLLRNLKLKTNEIIGWIVEMKAELLLGSLSTCLPILVVGPSFYQYMCTVHVLYFLSYTMYSLYITLYLNVISTIKYLPYPLFLIPWNLQLFVHCFLFEFNFV